VPWLLLAKGTTPLTVIRNAELNDILITPWVSFDNDPFLGWTT
jgi:hypothetical protein